MKIINIRYYCLKFIVPLLVLLWFVQSATAQTKLADVPALIPKPQNMTRNQQYFTIEGNESRMVRRIVSKLSGIDRNQAEAYRLKVTSDSVIILAETQAGLFRAQQTLNQLTATVNGKQVVAGCTITDWPAFQIRGFMQDAGRNFQSMEMLKEQIDVMAAYKFNTFHFHITDNPGWRLESKKYPQLKAETTMTRRSGKYYSQEDFLELVNYCSERFITLIPEFDIPGHSEAFRKAFALDSMSDPRVQPILLGLIDELCALVPAEKMPFIHLGTDEVWHEFERPATGLLEAAVERVKQNGREVIVWRPGQEIGSDNSSITQLWSSNGKPKAGHRYIDSRLNYLNHLDPLAGVVQLYFDRICGAPHSDSLRLGGILCCWNDNNVNEEYDILRQNPVYPGMLTYSETSWHGQKTDFGENYLAKLPEQKNPLFAEFQEFEKRLTEHRDKYFQNKPFPYIRQTQISWKITGPFNNDGDVTSVFPVENGIQENYLVNGKTVLWTAPVYGGTIHIHHFFGFPSLIPEKQGTVYATTNIWSPVNQKVDCWIGFHDWSRSGGRRGGPFPQQGQWHNTNPKLWLKGKMIEPPLWNNPGLPEKTEEISFTDENYFFREPAIISLEKGWNEVVLKAPHGGTSWKWMFTFVPVKKDGADFREVPGLKFNAEKE